MSMTVGSANRWVVVSAVTVGGIYAYQMIAGKSKATLGQFTTAWGVVFFILSLIATGAPGLSASLAILIMTADLLANIPQLAELIQSGLGNPAPANTAAPVTDGISSVPPGKSIVGAHVTTVHE